MKKHQFMLVAIVMALVSCTDQQFLEEGLTNQAPTATVNEFNALIEQARWGDGQAFLKLADCYRDGIGVEKDFVGMLSMAAQADKYGAISHMEDYLEEVPEGSDFKMIFDAIEKFEDRQIEEALSMSEQLIANGSADGYTVQGVMALEKGDTLNGIGLMERAAAAGSNLAELFLCFPEWYGLNTPDVSRLTALSDKIPFVNTILAEMYTGKDDESLKDENLAVYYFLKADKYACLGRRGARWLMGYHRNVCNLPVTEQDIQRLQILAGEAPAEEQTPTKCQDAGLEEAVSRVVQEQLKERNCDKGMVFVVETATGAIKAHVSLANMGQQCVPYEDTYNDELSAMLAGPAYLALLSSGKVAPEDVIDTGCGIYKDVRDHNWRRGGYGELTMEQALGHRSQVAFTKAQERAFGDNTIQLDNRIATYLADMPNSPMGILTFYNAIANGGRMVQLVTEGDDVIILNEQIAKPAHIEALQKGLHRAVTDGLFRNVRRNYTTVAACGRTIPTGENQRRMELCGYFPANNPLYTIMVIVEKNGLPASTGGICAPIMASTIDILVDSYDLRSLLVRENDEPQEIVEVVDTVVVE